MRINDVIKGKSSHDVITINPDATVRDLLALLAEHNIGAVIVSGGGSRASTGSSVSATSSASSTATTASSTRRCSEIMTAVVQTCEPGADVDELMAQMTEHRIRHVPVVDNGELVGRGQHRRRREEPDHAADVRARPARQLRAPDLRPQPSRSAAPRRARGRTGARPGRGTPGRRPAAGTPRSRRTARQRMR